MPTVQSRKATPGLDVFVEFCHEACPDYCAGIGPARLRYFGGVFYEFGVEFTELLSATRVFKKNNPSGILDDSEIIRQPHPNEKNASRYKQWVVEVLQKKVGLDLVSDPAIPHNFYAALVNGLLRRK